jgi:large subunit ribosomal protein L6
MSRIGKKPVEVPQGVTITVSDGKVAAKGPRGALEVRRHPLIDIALEAGQLVFTRKNDSRQCRAAHGLMRALCNNMVVGVSQGFERKLEINGVGYRAEVQGRQVNLQLGFSHPIEYELPDGVSAKVDKSVITLSGIDKEKLGAAAAKIRSFRPPEPYKGKGIRYMEEQISRKVGKAAG